MKRRFLGLALLSNTSRPGRVRLKLGLMLALLAGLTTLQLPQWLAPVAAAQAQGQKEQEEFFEKQVRPILAANCQMCHNPKVKTAGLDLSSAAGFLAGGESGPLVNKEAPAESRLLHVINYQEKLKMPPMGKLKDEEIATLTNWVKQGAYWPGAEQAAAVVTKPGEQREFSESELKFWAFQAMARPTPPNVKNFPWASSAIDRFILHKLEDKGVAPAPRADKLTLLRRATFDLTGLPPTEQEIRDFQADTSPDAFAKVVDRLLASPRYGERWGRHWLDVARYADSTGNDEDHRYPFAWRYRDYVINAFNQDLPYDQFIREQLAGDLLPPNKSEEVNRRGIIATGFLALGPKAIAQQDKKKMLYDVFDEQVDVTTRAFMGLTVACARCHDHKFDPILTKDYYSMIGIFASTRSFKDPDSHVSKVLEKPLVTKAEFETYQTQLQAHQEKVKRNKLALEEIINARKEPLAREWSSRLADYLLAARRVYEGGAQLTEIAQQEKLDEAVLKKWVKYLKPGDQARFHLVEWEQAAPEKLAATAAGYQQRFQKRLAEWQEKVTKWRGEYQQALKENLKKVPDSPNFPAGEDRFFHEVYFGKDGPFSLTEAEQDRERFAPEAREHLARLRKEQEELKKATPPEPELACAVEEGEPVEQKVFIRGDYNSLGQPAPKSFPVIITRALPGPEIPGGSGRLQLAEWLTQPEHPLTARVMANRIWYWHFGEGIVRTPDNYGKMGERPTHPELLDYLARKFVESGWSIKAMHRLIMLSSAYQMSSINPAAVEADPENRLFSRFPRRRLQVEEIRDALLALDGSIDLTMGGTLQTGRGTDGETSDSRRSLNPERLKRRTVYVPLRRANLPTLLSLYDFGDATTMAGKRTVTNVATQALFMMNSEFVQERALNVAQMLLKDQSLTPTARLERAYLLILNRPPAAADIQPALQYLAGYQAKFAGPSAELNAWQSLCRVLMASNNFIYVD